MRTQGVYSTEAEEIRTYILGMVMELADMADRVHDSRLAGNLRSLVWPSEPISLFRRQR